MTAMRELAPDYNVEVDGIDEDAWFEIMQKFDDANIYQTWSYDAIRCGKENISHLILKKNGTIVAAAQSRILKIPFINTGIAYIRWGPLWQLHGNSINIEIFCQAIRALRNEYVYQRGLVLRLFPVLFNDYSDTFIPLLKEEGFTWLEKAKHERTLLIDLSPSLEELRESLKQKWRNCLNHAERNDLEVLVGYNDKLFEKFIEIYREMLGRKKFVEPHDINEFRLIQKDLPENFKMKIILCQSDGNPCAGAICSAIGKTGIYLFGATNNTGMKNNGAYLLQWKILEWLKKNNYSWYDLNGINPEINPGTYKFKAGLCGKNGKDVYFLGQFDTNRNPLTYFLVKCGDILRSKYRKSKVIINNIRYQKK